MMRVTVEDFGEVVVLHCAGKIVHGHEASILCSAVHQQSRNIVLDLTEIDAIDAAGIGALASLQAAGVYLKLVNPTRQVREILKITNLDTIFEICESRAGFDEKSKLRGGQIQYFIAQNPLGEGDVEKSASPSA